jgi:transglutaminase-like putative cysteine protease
MPQAILRLSKSLAADWQARFTILFAGMFLYQIALWMAKEPYVWLPVTFMLITWTLFICMATEMLFLRLYRPAMRVVQLALILLLNAWVSGFTYTPRGAYPNLDQWLRAMAVQFHPLLWFSLGTWLALIAAIWWVQTKFRVFMLILIGVMAVAIRDSFSVLYLWDKAAMMIFCGLCLLVLRHLAQLKREKPAVWEYFIDYPLTIALPILLLLGVTMSLGLVAPDVRNVVKDPYTMWKNWKGEGVPQLGKIKPASGVTGPNASATSGYSRGDDQLGGGFNFDYTPVMNIQSDERSYWRGETRSVYTGKGWVGMQSLETGVNPGNPLENETAGAKVETVEVTQTVTIRKKENYPVLFGAYQMSGVRSINGSTDSFNRLHWSARDGELKWQANESGKPDYPDTYTIVSKIPVVDETVLREMSSQPVDRNKFAEYLQLPEGLPGRVAQLAADLTKDSSNYYDKAKKIEAYLKLTYPYTNTPNSNGTRDMDFVDRFLFEIKEGYCDYFSTAMAVLARSAGIPARWVKGYASGQLPVEELGGMPPEVRQRLQQTSSSGEYTIRNSDAHSWVEVYFEDYGWIPFEATSGFTAPAVNLPGETPLQLEPVQKPDVKPAAVKSGGGYDGWIYAGIAALGALGAFGFWLLARKRGWTLPDWLVGMRLRTLGMNDQVVFEFNRLAKAFKRKGLPIREYETVRETIGRWKQSGRLMASDLEELIALFEKAKYSKFDVTQEEVAKTSLLVKKLKESM